MKSYILTIIGALAFGCSAVSAQDYDDIYYDTGSSKSKEKATKVVKVKTGSSEAVRNPYFSQNQTSQYSSGENVDSEIVNGRDVDEYNRRYKDDAEAYYADEQSSYIISDSVGNKDFMYTDRMVKFHDSDVIERAEDEELLELYYESRPTVNLIVGTTYGGFYDPWYSWHRGFYHPYRYGYYDPWYSWNWGWHTSWYDPFYSWGHYYPYHGWSYCYPYYGLGHYHWYGHNHYGHYHGHYGSYNPIRYSDGGRRTFGNRTSGRNSVLTHGNTVSRSGRYSSGRPGYATSLSRRNSSGAATQSVTRGSNISRSSNTVGSIVSRPGTTGSIRNSVGASTSSKMSQRRSSTTSSQSRSSYGTRSYNSRGSYNSNSSSSYSRGSSYSSGRSSGSSSSRGSSGGGRGGRR